MNHKIGRNDPCPCGSGSGKKYKQCCGRGAEPQPEGNSDATAGAVERAVAWLVQQHRKGFSEAIRHAVEDAVLTIFDNDEDAANDALDSINDELREQLQVNLTEWMLAEGDIFVKGEYQPVSELLLGPKGPLLTTGQRDWLEQLARQPLRLYDVTEVRPGVGVTVCDALDTEQSPVVVSERSGSQAMKVGMQLGARLMKVGEQYQFSGALYPFSLWTGRHALTRLRELQDRPSAHKEDDVFSTGLTIIECWLEQYLVAPPTPELVDHYTGEPMLFSTDHYAVRDWDALTAALAAQPDVTGERDTGWERTLDCDDGQTRSQASIHTKPGSQRVSVQYRTAGMAEKGRAWFDALAGDMVKFELREVSDPRGMLANMNAQELQAPAVSTLPEGFDADTLADAIETMLLRTYANWADEPIPVLDNRTPRQAMKSPSGLERVKGLLRSYEDGEAQQAAQQGRRTISYQFLWDALGLKR